jgi:hypothetical protein
VRPYSEAKTEPGAHVSGKSDPEASFWSTLYTDVVEKFSQIVRPPGG